MHLSLPKSDEDYKKEQEEINKTIVKNKEKGEILSALAKEVKHDNDPEVMRRCRLARMVLDEGLDQYEDGSMSWEDFISDLNKCLKAI